MHKDHELKLLQQSAEHRRQVTSADLAAEAERLEVEKSMATEKLLLKKADHDLDLEVQTAFAELAKLATLTKVEATQQIATAFSPHLVEAILSMRDTKLMDSLSSHFSDLSVLEGNSLLATANRFLGDDLAGKLVPMVEHFISKRDSAEAAKEMDPSK